MLPSTISDVLTETERAEVEKLFEVDIEYVDHPSFHPPSVAEKKLFSTVLDIPETELRWYLLYMNARDGLKTWNQERAVPKQPLLSHEQEVALFLRFNFAKLKLSHIVNTVNSQDVSLKVLQDILRWHRLVLAIRKKIAEMNLAIVLSVASKYRVVMDGDVVAESNERLMNAIEHFDVSLGNKFSTYVWYAIRNTIIRICVNRQRERVYCPDDVDSMCHVENICDMRHDTERAIDSEAIHYILDHNTAGLTEREKITIQYRFFEQRPDGSRYVFEDIAAMCGVSRTCIQLTERDALKKIKVVWKKYMYRR